LGWVTKRYETLHYLVYILVRWWLSGAYNMLKST
jgi:hypothetical protein